MKDVEIAALCDVDERVIGDSMKYIEEKTGKKPAYQKDFRRLLDDRSIDAVTIATPNHWHSPPDDLGLPGRQGRLRREAAQPHRLGGPQGGRGRAEVRPDRPARHPEPLGPGPPRGLRVPARGQARQGQGRPRPLLQEARLDRQEAGRARPPGGGLRPLARPGAGAALQREPLPLPVALELGLRQRRHRQPGHPRDGHGAVGAGQVRPAAPRGLDRGPVRLRGRRRDPQHPARALRLRRQPADLRGARACPRRIIWGPGSASSSTARRAISSRMRRMPGPSTPTGGRSRRSTGPATTSGTSSTASGAGGATTSPPRSRRGTARPCWCTWRTSRTDWASPGPSPGTGRSAATTRGTRPSADAATTCATTASTSRRRPSASAGRWSSTARASPSRATRMRTGCSGAVYRRPYVVPEDV